MSKLQDVLSKSTNRFGDQLVRDNIESCLKRKLPEVFHIPPHGGGLNIVGGAPSLNTQLDRLRISKSPIWAVNGSVKHLIANGITPYAMVILDSCKTVADMIPNEDINFLVASQAAPEVFNKLHGRKVKVWHALVNADESSVIEKYKTDYAMVGGGCSTVLRCINLGYLLGFRDFHFYGFDCSIDERTHHAYETSSAYNQPVIKVEFNGKEYLTHGGMARQAADFVDMVTYFNDHMEDSINLTMHGEGLVQDIARFMGFSTDHKSS